MKLGLLISCINCKRLVRCKKFRCLVYTFTYTCSLSTNRISSVLIFRRVFPSFKYTYSNSGFWDGRESNLKLAISIAAYKSFFVNGLIRYAAGKVLLADCTVSLSALAVRYRNGIWYV